MKLARGLAGPEVFITQRRQKEHHDSKVYSKYRPSRSVQIALNVSIRNVPLILRDLTLEKHDFYKILRYPGVSSSFFSIPVQVIISKQSL